MEVLETNHHPGCDHPGGSVTEPLPVAAVAEQIEDALRLDALARETRERSRARRTRTLVMWSGGVDSTYALWRILRHGNDEVCAHHVRIRTARYTDEWRPRPEATLAHAPVVADSVAGLEFAAVNRLRPLISRQIRPFGFSHSTIDVGVLPHTSEQSVLLMFMAAQAALSVGLSPFDRIVFGTSQCAGPQWQPDTLAHAWHRVRLMRTLRAAWGAEEVPFLYLQSPRPDKRVAVRALGPALYALTVSCLSPTVGSEHEGDDLPSSPARLDTPPLRVCGRCEKCRLRARLQESVDSMQAGRFAGPGPLTGVASGEVAAGASVDRPADPPVDHGTDLQTDLAGVEPALGRDARHRDGLAQHASPDVPPGSRERRPTARSLQAVLGALSRTVAATDEPNQ